MSYKAFIYTFSGYLYLTEMMSFYRTYNSLSFFICENAFPWTDMIALLLRSLEERRKIGLEENNDL